MSRPDLARRIRRAVLWGAATLVVLAYAFPFVYLLLTSVKPASDAVAVPPTVLPHHITLANYITAINREGVRASFINSVTTATLATVISLVLAIPAAWGITRYRTRAGRVALAGALLVRMTPAVAIGVPLVGILGALHLTDTPTGLALAQTTVALPLSIWLLASFFESVPLEIEEAALVDGCSRPRALVSIILPVVAGGTAVTAIFAFLSSWNEFLFALLLTAVKAQTTPLAIANLQTQFGLDWGPMTALAALYSLPAVVLTLLLQRRIVAGLSLGAVKG
jgi:multiple sugar transport system permease protein